MKLLLFIVLVSLIYIALGSGMRHMTGGSQPNEYAYVMLLFRNEQYAEGVITVAKSIRLTGSKHDIVCMITPDISDSCIQRLTSHGIIVVPVPYLEYKTAPYKSEKQKARYGHWIGVSYTKWNALTLTQYKKVLFIDADSLVLKNVDHLFEKKTPASVFVRYRGDRRPANPWTNAYHTPKTIEENIKKRAWLIDGSLVLLTPNSNHYEMYKTMMEEMQPWSTTSPSGADESSLCYFMSLYNKGPKVSWTHLSEEYSCSWNVQCDQKKSYIANFVGAVKPWERDLRTEFPDTAMWYAVRDS
jgi:alpha-N-acetylglucosamine transferase